MVTVVMVVVGVVVVVVVVVVAVVVVVVVIVVVVVVVVLLLLLLGNYRVFDGAFFFTSRAFYSGFVLISAFLRGAAGLELTCCRCLKMCILWWFRADFTIFAGVWFCCFFDIYRRWILSHAV